MEAAHDGRSRNRRSNDRSHDDWVEHAGVAYGSGQGSGYPYMATVAAVDGSPNCQQTNAIAIPGALSARQDLESTPDGANITPCNDGPRIANDGYRTHAISTGFGWMQVPPPCGATYYRAKSYNFYNLFPGGPWVGGIHWSGWIFVWTAP